MRKNRECTAACTAPACLALGLCVFVSALFLVSCDKPDTRTAPLPEQAQARDAGYRVLRKLLGDEQHLKALRLAKMVVTLQTISEPTGQLIDDIAAASSTSYDRLEQMAALEPGIRFDTSCSTILEHAVLDPLRLATAKDLVTVPGDKFEISLLVSQVQALRMISQLVMELRDLDPNAHRQAWLDKLAAEYKALYKRAIARLVLAG
jgi:hypothetical protein